MTLSNELIVVDVETTGDNPFVHDLLSIALVPVVGTGEPLVVYVRPDNPTWTDCGQTTFRKFEREWQERAVAPRAAVSEIEGYLRRHLGTAKATLVGHNVSFDVAFLRKLAAQSGRTEIAGIAHRTIDTHTLLYLGYIEKGLPSSARTSTGAFEAFKIKVPSEQRHTALGDANATKALFLSLVQLFHEEGEPATVLRRRVAR